MIFKNVCSKPNYSILNKINFVVCACAPFVRCICASDFNVNISLNIFIGARQTILRLFDFFFLNISPCVFAFRQANANIVRYNINSTVYSAVYRLSACPRTHRIRIQFVSRRFSNIIII